MHALRVVLAEDHALLRAGLTQLLEAKGFEVIAAVDNLPELERALQTPTREAAKPRNMKPRKTISSVNGAATTIARIASTRTRSSRADL